MFNLIFTLFPIVWLIVVFTIVSKIVSASKQQKQVKKDIYRDFRNVAENIKQKMEDPPRNTASGSVHLIDSGYEKKSYVQAKPQPHSRREKSIHEKLNGEDLPKRGKLSRESRDDEKNWF